MSYYIAVKKQFWFLLVLWHNLTANLYLLQHQICSRDRSIFMNSNVSSLMLFMSNEKKLEHFFSVYTFIICLEEEGISCPSNSMQQKELIPFDPQSPVTCSYQPIRNKLEQPKKAKHSWNDWCFFCPSFICLQLQMECLTTQFLS